MLVRVRVWEQGQELLEVELELERLLESKLEQLMQRSVQQVSANDIKNYIYYIERMISITYLRCWVF